MKKQLAALTLAFVVGTMPAVAKPKGDKDKDKDADRSHKIVWQQHHDRDGDHDGKHDRDWKRDRLRDRDAFRRTSLQRRSKGRKTGWRNCDLPPGQAKKHGC